MRELVLTNGDVTKLNDEDYAKASSVNWYKDGDGYAYRKQSVGKANGRYRNQFLHRFILNAPKGISVDHINGDSLDNTRENLRLCSHKDNLRNQRLNKRNTSGYKGVYWHKALKKWRAMLTYEGKSVSLGCYEDKTEAARAYNQGAMQYFGEFARLNEGVA